MDADLNEINVVENLRQENAYLNSDVALLRESIAELELATESIGWRRIIGEGLLEFSESGLRRIVLVCQLVALKNPLLKRALWLRAAYVFGQGVDIDAPDPRVAKVIADFVALRSSQDTLFGAAARVGRDVSSGTDGNLFIACFTAPRTGTVTIRTVPYLEIGRTIHNPQDRNDPWFYRHDGTVDALDDRGNLSVQTVHTWYPAIGDHPGRPKLPWIESEDRIVRWDAPMLHIAEDKPDGWTYGVPVAYAAVDWAIAYKNFLTDWATYMKSMARYAYRSVTPARNKSAVAMAIRKAPGSDPLTAEPFYAGATAVLSPDSKLEAIPKTGASIDSDSASPLANMIAVAFGFPVTLLLGDPSKSNRSGSDAFDHTTGLSMKLHQDWWGQAYTRIFDHVIDSSVKAPLGYLRGKVTRDADGNELVVLANGRDRTVAVHWPNIGDITPAALVDAIVKADQTGTVPQLVTAKMLLQALGCADPDAVLATVTGPNGEYQPPAGSKAALELELLRAQLTALKKAALVPQPVPIDNVDVKDDAVAENPDDPSPHAPDPATSPKRVRNRASRPGVGPGSPTEHPQAD